MINKIKNWWIKLNKDQKKIFKIILVFQLFLIVLGCVLSILVYEGAF